MTDATLSPVQPALRVLLRGVVDYAGLFPPASLAMGDAVAEYARQRASAEAWMLGRFVLPAARLEEFEGAASEMVPREGAQSWALSALLGSDPEEDVERIEAFNRFHGDSRRGAVHVDTVELKAHSPRDVERAGELLDRRFDTYMEIAADSNLDDLVGAVARTKAKAKIRTGGVTQDAFPGSAQVARFMTACIARDVAFKATAGLHHPWRSEYPLTYAPDAPRGTMFGFLNMLLATALIAAGASEPEVIAALEERDGRATRFDAEGVRWRGHTLPMQSLQLARERLTAVGSCSFREPVAELRALHLL